MKQNHYHTIHITDILNVSCIYLSEAVQSPSSNSSKTIYWYQFTLQVVLTTQLLFLEESHEINQKEKTEKVCQIYIITAVNHEDKRIIDMVFSDLPNDVKLYFYFLF